MQNAIKFLRKATIIHFFVNTAIGVCHLIIFLELFWLLEQSKNIYYYVIFIVFTVGLFPIIVAIIITFKKITKTLMNNLKLVIKYFTFLEILLSIILSVCLSENQKELSLYIYICPFNYQINDIDKIFDNYTLKNEKMIKEKCKNVRCFFNEKTDDLDKRYLCNFDLKSNKKYCSKYSIGKGFISNKLINYFDYCENFVTFYKCQKPEKDFKTIINNYDYICPNKSDESLNISLLYSFLMIDIIFLCSPWLVDVAYIDELISSISEVHNDNNRNNNSLKDTNNTSKEQNEIEENNNNFERQPTQTIIIDNSENYINNKNTPEILNINKRIINTEDNKDKSQNKNEMNDNKSKSDIKLIDNINNNIFKIFNKNIIYNEAK